MRRKGNQASAHDPSLLKSACIGCTLQQIQGNPSADTLLDFKWRAFAARGPAQPVTHLSRIDLQLRQHAAEGVAVNAELMGGFALVPPMAGKHFQDESPFEFAHCFVVGDPAGVHLGDKTIQLAFHREPLSNPGCTGQSSNPKRTT